MILSNSLYLDHQATTPVDEKVLAKMIPYFRESFGNPHSADHSIGWESSHAVDQSAQQIARFIGADSDEIIFTSGATEANNLALLGLAKRAHSNSKKKRIILSAIEHKCILAIGRILENQFGYQVDHLPVNKEGLISISGLEEALDDDVLAVSIMAVNNEIGTIQDIKRISEIVRKSGAIFHCDAAQAPTAMDMRDFAQNTDLLSLSAHKMYGPKGIGALYIRRDLQEHIEPLIYGGGQQNGLRSGTIPTPLCVGMGAAAEILNTEETKKKQVLLGRLRDRFVEKLNSTPWPTKLNGPTGENRHPSNANICFSGFSAHDIINVLQPHLAASTGSACTSGITEPSHVLKAIGLTNDDAEASIRFSPGFETNDIDIDNAINLIGDALEKLSNVTSSQLA
ncbi:MAG: cysteine desulfurase [Candidatus Thiodiazotropha sp. (ex Lucinoma kastoroae)]|nr:cysteine desulfurase [Candidatus Thiodiazotropha sp. (ex Lucinoma kastoroae)]